MSKPTLTLYSNLLEDLSKLKGFLFSDSRWDEIISYVADDKFAPVILQNGKLIPEWFCHLDTGLMWGDWFKTQKHFVRARVLELFLTLGEIDLLNKYANDLWQEKRDREHFEKAEKIHRDNWDKPVRYGDQYYNSADEFIEDWVENLYTPEDSSLSWDDFEEEAHKHLPKYVWGVDKIEPILKLDADSIIEDATEEAHEDFDPGSLNGLKEFKEAVNKFVELNENEVGWYSSEKVAILLK